MKSKLGLALLAVALLCTSCDYIGNKRNRHYRGKIFVVRTEFAATNGIEPIVWSNANELTYSEEENCYTFFVAGKLVTLQPFGSVIVEEK